MNETDRSAHDRRLARWLTRRFLFLVPFGALVFGLLLISPASGAPVIVAYPIPRPGGEPAWITAGPDGNLWFTDASTNQIGRITPSGTITEFLIPTVGGGPRQITKWTDGNLWFNEGSSTQNLIERITPTGTITPFLVPSTPYGITAGPDGNLWFAESTANKIARMTPNFSFTEFPMPTPNAFPSFVTAGPDGNVWFFDANGVGRITPTGIITEFPMPAAFQSDPIYSFAAGLGSMWIGAQNDIWSVSPTGTFHQFLGPTFVEGITAGPERVSRMTLTGTVTNFQAASTLGYLTSITPGPDGNIWFIQLDVFTIWKLVLSSVGPSPPQVFLPTIAK